MIIPTSSALILVYSQNYTTFGPSQLAFLSTVRSNPEQGSTYNAAADAAAAAADDDDDDDDDDDN
eukprot:COSAG01_NODE_66907_length_268_cov_1.325444_1_plen_64_part_10